ncbi:GSCOCG00013552001-RA-CDS, partial [Cotesia congregata]
MSGEKFKITKAFICWSNIVFMISGVILMSLGILLLIDNNRILLSRLLNTNESVVKEPIFYYLALIVIGVGFLIALSGLLGCWVSCLANNCVTVLYMIILITLMISQLTVCVLTIFTPNLIGVDIRVVTLLRTLQRNYGLPGRQQFTAALDLAQTTFSCCGINGSNNYGTSWWRLQEVGRRNLVVPLTCCLLNNTNNFDAFLNPVVKDLETCQTLNPVKHQRARHTTGCLEKIEEWTQEQALLLLIIGLSIMFIELCALLSTLMGYKRKSGKLRKKLNKSQHNITAAASFTSTETLGRSYQDCQDEFGGHQQNQCHQSSSSPKSLIEQWSSNSIKQETSIETLSTTPQHHSSYQERGVDVLFTDPKIRPSTSSQNLSVKPKNLDLIKIFQHSGPKNILKKPGLEFPNDSQFVLSSKSKTVTSIPIKNFKNSLAQNFGTLRR